MKKTAILLLCCASWLGAWAQEETEMTQSQAMNYYKATSKRWVSIHDPSVVWEPTSKRYYVFGSHKAGAWTTDMQNWTQANPTWSPNDNQTAFKTPAVKKVKKGGVEVDLPQFNAEEWSHRTDAGYNVNGNMWAPDVIWNPTMKKWCMYLSINGDAWHSSIILLTADAIEGPYTYQGPVVICGFQDNGHSYKDTDLELVIGKQNTLPSRYAVGNGWGRRWPHTIDPAVFFDEDDKLWLVYGSWSGGIWMLELNEENGLRDYDVTYPSTNGSSDGVTSDPYFGKKVGGGYYVSGEGPYIEHIGNYYYLFVSYGGFAPDGGYEMRVFRSQKPDGPYVDGMGRSAIFDRYVLNYGAGNDNRGAKIMGAYNHWGFMTVGETAQGHNSIIAAEDGRTYLVYHTKFNDGTAGHQVRTHQVFQNKVGWLVAAPFEYNGEQTLSADVASKELVPAADIPGTYEVLIHKYVMDHNNMEEVTPKTITLSADGKVSGAYSGTWAHDEGTSYLRVVMNGVTYNGVLTEQQMDYQNMKAICFSAMASSGITLWGYRLRDDYALARQLRTQKVPLSEGLLVSRSVDLYGIHQGDPNVSLVWRSSLPSAISSTGRYNPEGLAEDADVTLTGRLQAGRYFWQQDYHVKAAAYALPDADWQTGMLAHYGFDGGSLLNSLNPAQTAQLLRKSSTKLPAIEEDSLHAGVVHLSFGAHDKESYVAIENPLYGRELADGATLSFWVRRADDNLWDALYGFYDETTGRRLYMTGNCYTGFNDNAGTYLDINHPNTVQTTYLESGQWHLATVVFNRAKSKGIQLYVDGILRSTGDKFAGTLKGADGDTEVTRRNQFSYDLIVDLLASSKTLYLGYGSFWGSADACFDDVIVYDRPLSVAEAGALRTMCSRVYDFSGMTSGISQVTYAGSGQPKADDAIFDLSGRRIVGTPRRGIYVKDGRKVVIGK